MAAIMGEVFHLIITGFHQLLW